MTKIHKILFKNDKILTKIHKIFSLGEFHQVCHEVSLAFLVLIHVAFSNSSRACCGTGKCDFNNFKLTFSVTRQEDSWRMLLSHTILRNVYRRVQCLCTSSQ